MRVKTKSNRNKWVVPLLISALVLTALSAGYLFLAHKQAWWPYVAQTTPIPATFLPAKDDPNTPDPTYSSAKNTNTHNSTNNANNQSSTSSTVKQVVSVAITYVGSDNDPTVLDVHAFVSGIIEGTGTCTATLTNGSSSVTASAPAFIDATTTQCEAISIPHSKLSNGTWKVVVQYSSPTSTGTSEATTTKI